MSSYYLTDDAGVARLAAMRRRLAAEVRYTEDGAAAYWPPDSDYHALPVSERCEVVRLVRLRNLAADVVDLGSQGLTFLPDSPAWDLTLEEQRTVTAEYRAIAAERGALY